MNDYALTSLQPHAPVTVTHGGWLHSPDLWIWAGYGLVALLAALSMPTGLRESAKSLWRPVGAWLAALRCDWLWAGVFIVFALPGALRPILAVLGVFLAIRAVLGSVQELREGFWGWWPPLKV